MPDIVITFSDQEADTPGGSPVEVPIPVAPVVLCEMFVSGVLMQRVRLGDVELTVLLGITVIDPVLLRVKLEL